MLTDQPITIDLAEEILKDMSPKESKDNYCRNDSKVVADHYKLTVQEFKMRKEQGQ